MSVDSRFGIGAEGGGVYNHNVINDFAALLQGPGLVGRLPPSSVAATANPTPPSSAALRQPPTQLGSRFADLIDPGFLITANSGASSSASIASTHAPSSTVATASSGRWCALDQASGKSISTSVVSNLASATPMAAVAEPGFTSRDLMAAAGHSAINQKRPAAAMAAQAMEGEEQSDAYFRLVNKEARRTRSWDQMFEALVSFRAVHGHCNVPLDHADAELALWVRGQHAQRHFLSMEERYKLSLIGLPLETTGPASSLAAATTMFSALGASSLPATAFPGANMSSQFELYRQHQRNLATVAAHQQMAAFSAQRHAALTAHSALVAAQQIAADPTQRQASSKTQTAAARSQGAVNGVEEEQHQWIMMFRKLQAHHVAHGGFDALSGSSYDPAFRLWMMEQMNLYKSGNLTQDRLAKLKSVNFINDGTSHAGKGEGGDKKKESTQKSSVDSAKRRVRSFEENFKALLDYKKKHGNVDVPQKYEKDRKLGIWVKNIRQHPNRHTEEQRIQLESVGFKWRKLQLDEQWNDAFDQLIAYRDKYGDCNVPSRWKSSPALARWVHTQRTMYRRNKLVEERKEKLEEAGFVWDCHAMRDDEAFHENYEKLVAFKAAKGHCSVPNKYRRDRPLGRWAAKMRELYTTDQLDADRLKALNDIGFVWVLEPTLKKGVAGDINSSQCDDDDDDDDEESSGDESDSDFVR